MANIEEVKQWCGAVTQVIKEELTQERRDKDPLFGDRYKGLSRSIKFFPAPLEGLGLELGESQEKSVKGKFDGTHGYACLAEFKGEWDQMTRLRNRFSYSLVVWMGRLHKKPQLKAIELCRRVWSVAADLDPQTGTRLRQGELGWELGGGWYSLFEREIAPVLSIDPSSSEERRHLVQESNAALEDLRSWTDRFAEAFRAPSGDPREMSR